jgi:dipeptide/tripeptide permease
MASDLGAIIGPLVAGLLAQNGSFPLAFGVTAGVVALGAVASTLMPETGGRSRAREGAREPGDVPSPM